MTREDHVRVVDSYELSPTQEGMLFHRLLGEGTGVDLEQIVCRIRGQFDEDAFVGAFHTVAARHAILRTRFHYDGADRPAQEVVEAVEIPVERLDLTGVPPSARSSRFDEALRLDRARGIDLECAPCMRLIVVDHGPDEHRVVWTFHHALLDGRSFPLVLREVIALYDAADAGRVPALRSPRPYREYIEFLRGLDLGAAERYWRDRLAGFTTPTPLVVDRAAIDEQRTDDIQGVFERRLSREQTAALRELAAARGVTLNTLAQSAWAILLHRYSRETEVVFGATRACRRSAVPDADEMVGLFINTLPLRVRVDPEARLDELLKDVRAQQVQLRAYEHTPLVNVQGWSEVPRGSPLFETILVYEERTLDTVLRTLAVDGARLEFAYHGQTNYPLALIAYGDDEMLVRLESDRRRVDDAPASRVLDHFVTLLTAMPQHADCRLHELPLLSEGERIGLESAGVGADVGLARCLHVRFEERARVAPGQVAVVCDGQSLTYAQLDRRANALALRLRSLGVRRDVLVGLRTERSLSVVVGILGILKAGGAYVPLDPAYPRERVEFMLADSGVRVVVTEAGFIEDFAACGASLVVVDREDADAEAEVGPEAEVEPGDLAYVMYTSGSTGEPKGVLISHQNVSRLFDATDGWFGFGEDDVWSLFHSYAFDFSVWEMWGALLYGGRLVVVPFWVSRSPEAFRELVLRERVTVLNQTPSAFGQFVAADEQAGPPVQTDLRYVIFGGEALELPSLRPWFDRHGDARPQLVNMYGITETTVHVTYRPISIEDLQADAGSVIGMPIPDLRLFVLDAYGSPVPTGVAGEMHVGGGGVSRGYLDRAELTAQRFVADPFADGDGRLYRTGDLARRLENGDLEYLGRIDDQVKIRGFRIELGEIEAVLARHPAVRDAVVLARQDAGLDKRLVAYVVAAGRQGELIEQLKTHLRAKLPEYMVPAHYVLLDQLPLTPNGKTDRKALPAPDYGRREVERPFVAPRTATEETLAAVWAAVLGAPRVSIDDNFFELGGDSILTIQVIARCRRAGLQLTPRDLAKQPTVAQLAQVIASAAPTPVAEPEPDRGPVRPMPIQSWFFEQRFANPHHWNQAFLFEIAAGVDLDALQHAVGEVVAHHDALRLRVAGQDPELTLRHESSRAVPAITRVDLTAVSPDAHAATIETAAVAAQSQLHLHDGPLLAVVHFDRGATPGRLLIAVHHLAVDGVSWRLLIEDLETAYRALRAGAPVQLPPRSASVRRWSQALVDAAANPALVASSAHWLKVGSVPGDLPAEGTGEGANTEASARTATVSLESDETQALLQRVPAAYGTQINDVLLTALALALRGWTGRDAHRIDMEGHGREDALVALDVSRTVGWFTSLYPAVVDLAAAQDHGSALKLVKEQLRRVPDRGLSYGVLRYASRDAAVARPLAAQPSAQLLFNYLGQFDQVVAGSQLLRFAAEPTGAWHGPTNERAHRIEVVAAVRDGRFEAGWTYGAERDQPQVIQRLADGFIAALRRLIAHCLQPGVAGYTPSDFPLVGLEQDALDRLAERYAEIADVYPLSPMQRLFLSMEARSSRIGFEQWVFRLRGPLDPVALRKAWEATVARHAMLRTAFVTDAVAEPLQVVKRRVAVPWAEEDWSGKEAADEAGRLQSFLAADRERGFDVGVGPLTRVTLIRVGDEEHQLVWSTHHLCVDGWSWPLIIRDVGSAYEALREGTEPRLPEPCQYGAYIGWLAARAPDSRDFWTAALEGFQSATPLALETTPTADANEGICEASTRLDAQTTAALRSLARTLQLTLNTVVQGAWAILLSHLSERDDVVFGAAFSGRPAELAGVEGLVGPCVNNLPMPVQLPPERSAADWLPELHERNLEIAQHQYASLSDIQEWAAVPWRQRLFDSLVVFQNYVVDEAVLRWGTLDVEPVTAPEATNYPLTLTVAPGPEMDLKLMGQANRFGPASLTMMLDGLAQALSSLAERPDASLAEIRACLPASTKGTAAVAAAGWARRRQSAYVAPASEMERVVAGVWEELFEVDELGVEDNFFDLGGHSILLLQAHARLRERLANDVSVVALLQYPTIRSLARHLSNAEMPSAAVGAVRDRAMMQRRALARQRSRQGRR